MLGTSLLRLFGGHLRGGWLHPLISDRGPEGDWKEPDCRCRHNLAVSRDVGRFEAQRSQAAN